MKGTAWVLILTRGMYSMFKPLQLVSCYLLKTNLVIKISNKIPQRVNTQLFANCVCACPWVGVSVYVCTKHKYTNSWGKLGHNSSSLQSRWQGVEGPRCVLERRGFILEIRQTMCQFFWMQILFWPINISQCLRLAWLLLAVAG